MCQCIRVSSTDEPDLTEPDLTLCQAPEQRTTLSGNGGDAMVQTSTAHSERINLRLSETAKRRIEQAASVEGKTVSAFIVSSALATAEKTIDRHETLALARDDALRFFDALADPPPPNDRLRAALEEHARRVDSR